MRTGRIASAWAKSALALVAALVLASAPAHAVPLCDPNGFGGEIQDWPAVDRASDSAFHQKAQDFENRWREEVLVKGRPRHLNARTAAGVNIAPSVKAQETLFSAVFAANGDIVRACAAKKQMAAEIKAYEDAKSVAEAASGDVAQCEAFRKVQSTQTSAAARVNELRGELDEKFRRDQGKPGARFRSLVQLRDANAKNVEENRAALGVNHAGLVTEAKAIWDANGFFAKALQQGADELDRETQIRDSLQQNSDKLRALAQKCGTAGRPGGSGDQQDGRGGGQSRTPGAGSGGNGGGDGSTTGGEHGPGNGGAGPGVSGPTGSTGQINNGPAKGETSSFLADNWGWLAGGAAVAGLVGGGAYLYQDKVARDADDANTQALRDSLLAQASTATTVTTDTTTSTATATATDTATGLALFAPMDFSGKEMEPLELSFAPANAGATLTLSNVPAGAVWDPSTRLFRWIPALGQAGNVEMKLSDGKSEQLIRLKIDAAVVADFPKKGPPDHFRDGDVGYIFIHGAGGTVDRCNAGNDLATYWGATPSVVAPDSATRTVACYDGRQAVATQAKRVAQQILDANCGRYRRCILVTHSMGGLLVEHMFTHARPTRSGDVEGGMYDNHDLYKQARDKTLMVVSLASAAGGSKVADILEGNPTLSSYERIAGVVSRAVGANNAAYKNLESLYASKVVAPLGEDPGVPIFMVPGYSKKTLYEDRGIFDYLTLEAGDTNPKIFNGESSLALLDYIASFGSRSDGLVDFRSSCGIQDASPSGGPGYQEKIPAQLMYCGTQTKKPNHYLWFVTNLNHYDIATPSYHCLLQDNPCETLFPQNGGADGFQPDTTYTKLSAVEVMRQRLTKNSDGAKATSQAVQLGF